MKIGNQIERCQKRFELGCSSFQDEGNNGSSGVGRDVFFNNCSSLKVQTGAPSTAFSYRLKKNLILGFSKLSYYFKTSPTSNIEVS